MKPRLPKAIIALPTTPPQYVDEFDGENYKWTTSRKTAWRMHPMEALSRAARIQQTHPDAFVQEI